MPARSTNLCSTGGGISISRSRSISRSIEASSSATATAASTGVEFGVETGVDEGTSVVVGVGTAAVGVGSSFSSPEHPASTKMTTISDAKNVLEFS